MAVVPGAWKEPKHADEEGKLEGVEGEEGVEQDAQGAEARRQRAGGRDAPDVDIIFIESDDGLGPFGAKSMGESSKVPAPAAVANAVANAIGVRMKDLPITRDKIVAAVAARTGARS